MGGHGLIRRWGGKEKRKNESKMQSPGGEGPQTRPPDVLKEVVGKTKIKQRRIGGTTFGKKIILLGSRSDSARNRASQTEKRRKNSKSGRGG